MITPMEIYQREFKRKALNGLDPEDVEDFLFQVAEDMEKLIEENKALKNQQGGAAPPPQQEQPQPASVNNPVNDNRAAQALEQAAAEAARIKSAAAAEAKAIVKRARDEAANIQREGGHEQPPLDPADDERMKRYQDLLVRHLSQLTMLMDEEGVLDESGAPEPAPDSATERTETTLLESDADNPPE